MREEKKSLLDALPGIELQVGEVTSTLATMWQENRENSGNFRASQLNLILHFGVETNDDEALERFRCVIRFGQRYPCRVIILCPGKGRGEAGEGDLKAKLFTQCYIGPTMREMCCCEALMLSYATSEFVHLKNQVTVWLEADLPVYHWFHQVPASRIESHYLKFIHSFLRVIYDSAVEGESYDDIDWPRPQRVADLATARLLPVKQVLGPFLAGYPPEVLVEGLEKIRFSYSESWVAEGRRFREWILSCLKNAYGDGSEGPHELQDERVNQDDGADTLMDMRWVSFGKESLHWVLKRDGHMNITANFGKTSVSRSHAINWFTPEMALSEAVFF